MSSKDIFKNLGGWLEIKSRPILRHLIKAQYPRVVGSLVGTAAVRIDEISWGETIVWNAGSH